MTADGLFRRWRQRLGFFHRVGETLVEQAQRLAARLLDQLGQLLHVGGGALIGGADKLGLAGRLGLTITTEVRAAKCGTAARALRNVARRCVFVCICVCVCDASRRCGFANGRCGCEARTRCAALCLRQSWCFVFRVVLAANARAQTNFKDYPGKHFVVTRRYSDFAWLKQVLNEKLEKEKEGGTIGLEFFLLCLFWSRDNGSLKIDVKQ